MNNIMKIKFSMLFANFSVINNAFMEKLLCLYYENTKKKYIYFRTISNNSVYRDESE